MAIILRDEHLEEQIAREGERRGDKTLAKTLGDLVREYLTQLETRRDRPVEQQNPKPALA